MGLTNVGLLHIAGLVIGEPLTPFDINNVYLAIGDGTDPFTVTQTDLVGGNQFRKAVDLATRNGPVYTYQTLLNTNEANFAWREYDITNANTEGIMLNRKMVNRERKHLRRLWSSRSS